MRITKNLWQQVVLLMSNFFRRTTIRVIFLTITALVTFGSTNANVVEIMSCVEKEITISLIGKFEYNS